MPIDPLPPLDRGRFLEVELPEHFVVEVVTDRGEWLDGNGYLREDCTRLDDGSYVCGNRGGGSPQWIRCVAHLPDSFIHLDGGAGRGAIGSSLSRCLAITARRAYISEATGALPADSEISPNTRVPKAPPIAPKARRASAAPEGLAPEGPNNTYPTRGQR